MNRAWKIQLLALIAALGLSSARADHRGFGGFGGASSHHGDFGRGGGLDGLFGATLGGGFFDAERLDLLQTRYETKFADLQADYDDGLATSDDFYSSDEYDAIVSRGERLVDRYDLFVDRVELSVDLLGGAIEATNSQITYLDDLLAEYQERTDLSQTRLERIENWITTAQDRLTLKVDWLTESQSALSDELPGWQEFQTTLTTYVDGIVAAGASATTTDGTTSGDVVVTGDGSVSASTALAIARATASVAAANESFSAAVRSVAAVPEPSMIPLAIGGLTLAIGRRLRRRAR